MDSRRRPVGRLAPSPTGHLHLGHARSFLLAWWHARSRGGRVLLRFEDLDEDRARAEHIGSALQDLAWLGLDWDGPPLLQSERIVPLMDAARELQERGLVYPCVCSRSDIRTAQSAPHGATGESRYPGTCRGRFATTSVARTLTNRQPGLRFVVQPGAVSVPDCFVGHVSFDPEKEVGDFLIARRDGSPAYQLAVVVDDLLEGVTDVVRGDDLLPSAARQMLLLDALGQAHPNYYHVPLVCDGQGRRLAKREDDLSLTELRALGVDPRSIVEWVARHSGFPDARRPEASELVAAFSMAQVPRHPVRITPSEIARLRAAR